MQPNLEGIVSTLIETKARIGGRERPCGAPPKRGWAPWHQPGPPCGSVQGTHIELLAVPAAQSTAFPARCSGAQAELSDPQALVGALMAIGWELQPPHTTPTSCAGIQTLQANAGTKLVGFVNL